MLLLVEEMCVAYPVGTFLFLPPASSHCTSVLFWDVCVNPNLCTEEQVFFFIFDKLSPSPPQFIPLSSKGRCHCVVEAGRKILGCVWKFRWFTEWAQALRFFCVKNTGVITFIVLCANSHTFSCTERVYKCFAVCMYHFNDDLGRVSISGGLN
jgi:hypothetical protein